MPTIRARLQRLSPCFAISPSVPGSYEANEALGALYAEAGDLAARRFPTCSAACELAPRQALAHANLGAAYLKLGEASDAVRELRKSRHTRSSNAATAIEPRPGADVAHDRGRLPRLSPQPRSTAREIRSCNTTSRSLCTRAAPPAKLQRFSSRSLPRQRRSRCSLWQAMRRSKRATSRGSRALPGSGQTESQRRQPLRADHRAAPALDLGRGDRGRGVRSELDTRQALTSRWPMASLIREERLQGGRADLRRPARCRSRTTPSRPICWGEAAVCWPMAKSADARASTSSRRSIRTTRRLPRMLRSRSCMRRRTKQDLDKAAALLPLGALLPTQIRRGLLPVGCAGTGKACSGRRAPRAGTVDRSPARTLLKRTTVSRAPTLISAGGTRHRPRSRCTSYSEQAKDHLNAKMQEVVRFLLKPS